MPFIVMDPCQTLLRTLPCFYYPFHLSRSVKVGVTLTFLTGSMLVLSAANEILYKTGAHRACSCSGLVTSVIRCVEFFLHNALKDGIWNSVTFLVWSVVEPGVYLIAACLPCYRHLYNYIKTGDAQSSTGSRFSRSGKRKLQAKSAVQNVSD